MSKILKAVLPCLLFAVLLLLIATTSMRRKSITNDELAHAPAGYTYVALKDYQLNPEHPPLLKYLSGLLIATAHPKIETDNWKSENQWLFGEKFLYKWNDADRMLFLGRLAIVFVSLLLGISLYLCAWELYGWKAGCLALSLYLINPDFLAHGQLVTTDLGLSCFIFLAVYTFCRALNRLSLGRVLLAGLATGLALVSKFSGVLIFPMFMLVGAVFVFTKQPIDLPPLKRLIAGRTFKSHFQKTCAALGLIVVVGLMGWLVIWVSYGFRYQVSPDPAISQNLAWKEFQLRPGLAMDLAIWARNYRLAPEAYAYGFAYVARHTEGRWAFLLGEYSPAGYWYYFLATFLVKTPLALIILIGLGFYFIRRYGVGWRGEAMLLLPALFYLLFALATPLNIGHRHILPIYPFLIVFAAKMARVFDESQARRLQWAIGLLLAWNIGATAYIYPHFLAYFNEIAGGPSRGYRWLVDSNLDWGQDMKGLGEWRRRHPEGKFYVSYFGNGDPNYYLPDGALLPSWPKKVPRFASFDNLPQGSLVAISASNLQCLMLGNQAYPGIEEFMARMRGMTPIDHIGYSIFIYRMP